MHVLRDDSGFFGVPEVNVSHRRCVFKGVDFESLDEIDNLNTARWCGIGCDL